jgi:polysaccharide export outer membrane protein
MIVGFTKENVGRLDQQVRASSHSGTAIHRWGVEIGQKAIASSPLTRHSILGHYRIFETKRLQQKINGAKWDEPVQTFTKKGISPMKWSLVILMAMLLAKPAAGVAQLAPLPSAAPATADKPAAPPAMDPSQKSPKADSSDIAHYIIGAEDNLQITVWKEPTLSGTVPVRPDGRISLVLLGDLQAAGMTPMQLAADVTQRLKKYIQDPSVSVVVLAVNSQRIYIIGEVGHVGPIAMAAGMSPLQAIAAAGGLSPFANSKHIYILRGTGAKQQKIPFNYKQALKGDSKQDVSLEPGDTIVVP